MPIASFDLTGKVALVTGGARGIGRAIALAFAEHGADVAVLDVLTDPLKTTATGIESAGRKALALECDVTSTDQVRTAVRRTIDELGGLHVVVNNAGRSAGYARVESYPEDVFARLIDVNLTGAFRVCQAAGPHLLAQSSGSVINVSSMSGTQGTPGNSGYASSKWGMIGLTQTLAKEWAPAGIRVNTICPGVIRTDIWGTPSDELVANLSAQIPMGRWGTPEECAGAAVFFASDASSYVSGANILVDGAWTA